MSVAKFPLAYPKSIKKTAKKPKFREFWRYNFVFAFNSFGGAFALKALFIAKTEEEKFFSVAEIKKRQISRISKRIQRFSESRSIFSHSKRRTHSCKLLSRASGLGIKKLSSASVSKRILSAGMSGSARQKDFLRKLSKCKENSAFNAIARLTISASPENR